MQIPLTLFRPERYGQAGAPRQSVLDGVFHEGLKNILRRKTVQYALFEGLDLQRQLVHISKTLNVHVRLNVFQLGFESGHRIAAIERGSEHAHSAFEHFDSVRRIVLFQKKADGGEDIEQKMWRKLAFDGHQLQIDAGFLLSQQLQFSVFQIFLLFVQRNDEGMDVVGQQIDFDNSGFLAGRHERPHGRMSDFFQIVLQNVQRIENAFSSGVDDRQLQTEQSQNDGDKGQPNGTDIVHKVALRGNIHGQSKIQRWEINREYHAVGCGKGRAFLQKTRVRKAVRERVHRIGDGDCDIAKFLQQMGGFAGLMRIADGEIAEDVIVAANGINTVEVLAEVALRLIGQRNRDASGFVDVVPFGVVNADAAEQVALATFVPQRRGVFLEKSYDLVIYAFAHILLNQIIHGEIPQKILAALVLAVYEFGLLTDALICKTLGLLFQVSNAEKGVGEKDQDHWESARTHQHGGKPGAHGLRLTATMQRVGNVLRQIVRGNGLELQNQCVHLFPNDEKQQKGQKHCSNGHSGQNAQA